MWKTLGGFSAQISRFQHILPLSTAQINCSRSGLTFIRRPYVYENACQAHPTRWNRHICCWHQPEEVWINKPPEKPKQFQILSIIQAA
jgi:hypothetical protein